jgi:hypothetical protein
MACLFRDSILETQIQGFWIRGGFLDTYYTGAWINQLSLEAASSC